MHTPDISDTPRPGSGSRLPVLALLWLAGAYLRVPILAAPPLAPLIAADLNLNQTAIGALTTVPVLMLSLAALPGARLIARSGPRTALVGALVLLAAASSARGLAPPVWMLFLQTALLGVAVAAMQPALPALVVRWCPGFLALGSAVYMNGMLMGEFISAGLTLPVLLPLLDGSWRATLIAWSLPALLVAALIAGRKHPSSTAPPPAAAPHPPWRDRRVWHLGVVLGAASAGFFGTNAYMGPVLEARNETGALPAFLFWFNATQVAGSVLMIGLARVLVGRRLPVVLAAWSVFLGLAGIMLGGSTASFAAALLVGLATCVQLILAVSLVPQIADEHGAAPLAAGMFLVGYLLGFAVPLAGGLLADATADARAALLPMALLALAAAGLAQRSQFVHREARSGSGREKR